MKTLSRHIQESFTENKEEQQTVIENTQNIEEIVSENSAEKEKSTDDTSCS